MPELPEVEITRRGVEQRFLSQILLSCEVRQAKLRWPVPRVVQDCVGFRLAQVGRRSKYLLMDFGSQVLVVHLGMSGSLNIVDANTPWQKHDHIEWVFGNGVLRYNDPRRFGSVEWVGKLPGDVDAQWMSRHSRFSKLGPEPFSDEFTPEQFFKATRGKLVSIKALLLSGVSVVGVGNIYACESLFRSGIAPDKVAGKLKRVEALSLHQQVRAVLSEAIARGGSSLRNFHAIDGKLGHFQLHCDVYGREGQPCRVCGDAILRKVMGQRSTFFCARCQK